MRNVVRSAWRSLAVAVHELVANSARVFRYDREFGISTRLVRAVSDHYPVFAEYRIIGPDDDGPRRK